MLGTLEIARALQARWKVRELQREWADRYPQLFDEQDLRLALGKQARFGFHFVEWLGAIAVSTISGYRALVAKYQYANHPAKRRVVSDLGLAQLLRQKHPTFGNTQGPDLLMYRPDGGDYFFCEVKGPGDVLKPRQTAYFQHLEVETGRPIRMLRLKWAPRRPDDR